MLATRITLTFSFEYVVSKQSLYEPFYTEHLQLVSSDAVEAAEIVLRRNKTEPSMFDAHAATLNLASRALEKECLYTDPSILDFRRDRARNEL